MSRKSSKIDRQITAWVNSLTPEQACKLIDIAHPMTAEEHAQYDAMSDDELLAALDEPDMMGCTDWIAFGHHGFTHYGVSQRRLSNGYMQQRHSWKREDGTISREDWIDVPYRDFSADTHLVTAAEGV